MSKNQLNHQFLGDLPHIFGDVSDIAMMNEF